MNNKLKKIIATLSMLLICTVCSACGPEVEQVFSEPEFDITLTNQFVKETAAGADYAYNKNGDMVIVAGKDSKQEIKDAGLNITSLNRYAILSVKSFGAADNALVREGLNHSYCEFETIKDGKSAGMYTAFYETETDYWTFVFVCDVEDFEKNKGQFANWASTVKIH